MRDAARSGQYQVGGKLIDATTDNLGDTVLASIGSVDYPNKKNIYGPENGTRYGNLHSLGHSLFAELAPGASGIMSDLFATSRDPIFWRWHKHIDTIIQDWRTTLGAREPHDFTDGPSVRVRSKDIILCQGEGLPKVEVRELKELAANAFGYSEKVAESQWEKDFSQGEVTVNITDDGTKAERQVTVATTAELLTEMRSREIYPWNPTTKKEEAEEIEYLSHEHFSYFIRLQNLSPQPQEVIVRVFLAPELWANAESSENTDNTVWIEMDRFLQQLDGGERAVVFRPARQSAVIRKPAIGHAELEGTEPRDFDDPWCDCGWPYNLLLPRGTEDGMDFRLLVMVSSGDDLAMIDTTQERTSMGYCGLKNMKYPDRRPMGYPFDQPLPDSIDSICDKHKNWASRKIKIRNLR